MTLLPLLLDVSKQLFTVTSFTCISLKVMLGDVIMVSVNLRFGFCAVVLYTTGAMWPGFKSQC